MKNGKKLITTATTVALVFTLASCGNGGETEEVPSTSSSPTATEDFPVGENWSELDDYDVPKEAVELWGEKKSTQGVKAAMNSMFRLYTDEDAARLDGSPREVEDYALAQELVTDRLAEEMSSIIKDAAAGKRNAGTVIGMFFPQSLVGEDLNVNGEIILSDIEAGINEVKIRDVSTIVGKDDVQQLDHLVVNVRHDVTHRGILDGKKQEMLITKDLQILMLPTGKNDAWEINGLHVKVVGKKYL